MGVFEQGPVPAIDAFHGLITVNETCPRWPAQAWPAREWTQPFFMCGPGDPEDFLYRGTLNPDGTRDGDQMALIQKLKGTGANCIYLMAVRSHGGDGDATHNPFVDHDPAKGINPLVLDQWEEWFTEMDRHGIVTYFFLYDDSARLWRMGDEVGEPEREFIETLVNRFEHHAHLIWCIAEEYSEALSVERVTKIAALIKATDDYKHPVAVHKHHGLDFSEFADDPHIDQFAIQYNVKTAEELHAGVLQAWHDAKGRYSLNLSEAADWGTGAEARKKAWACAMAGAQVMVLGMDIATTPENDLRDCGNVVRFFEGLGGLMDLCAMAPHDELAYGDTEYVLVNPPFEYVAYTSHSTGQLGLKSMEAGLHDFHWLDCATGRRVSQERVAVAEGSHAWRIPAGFAREVAVHIRACFEVVDGRLERVKPALPSGKNGRHE